MTICGRWTRVFVDGGRCFVYGTTLGRLYLLNANEATEPHFQRLLGLRSLTLCDDLADPAERIVHNLSNLKAAGVVEAPVSLRIAYHLLNQSRHVVPLRGMARLIRRLAKWSTARKPLTVSEIGHLVHAIEQANKLADCYPRALITSYLCLKNRLGCDLAVGTLAPTRKMHAWCSTEGQLPYEASPEHYMYQPLMVLTLLP